jgi:hypothetical protein
LGRPCTLHGFGVGIKDFDICSQILDLVSIHFLIDQEQSSDHLGNVFPMLAKPSSRSQRFAYDS